MTVPNSTRTVIYQGNGLTTVFPYTFEIPVDEDAQVSLMDSTTGLITDILDPSEYSITGIGTASGNVTYPLSGSPLASGFKIIIERLVDYVQEADLVNQGGFYPETVEGALDFIVMQTQQLAEETSRAILVPPGEEGMDLPNAATRAGSILGFDDSGDILLSLSYTSLLDAAAAADAARILAEEAAQQAAAIVIQARPIRTVSADYLVTADDLGYLLRIDAAASTNVYVPPDLDVGFWCDIEQFGAGSVYILPYVDATVQSLAGQNKITGQYGLARVIVDTANTINLSGDLNGTGSTGWILAARIRADGWTIELDLDSSRFAGSMDVSKIVDTLAIVSEGYVAVAGVPGSMTLSTVSRSLSINSVLRKAYSLQAEDQVTVTGDICTLVCALSGFVYDDDKNGGAGTSGTDPVLTVAKGWWIDGLRTGPAQTIMVTNNSVEDYPTVNVAWNVPPALISSDHGNKFVMSAVGAGAHAKFGKLGIAGVKFTATGQTSAVVATSVVDTLTVASGFSTARTLPAIEWLYAPSDAAFTQGELVTKNFIAYPRIGDANSVRDSSTGTFGSSNRPSPYVDVCNKSGTYGRLYAAFDPVGGNDAAGVVNATRATAVATPFQTFQRACYALQTQSGVSFTRSNLGNHYIVLCGSTAGHSLNMKATDPAAPAVVFAQDDCGAQDTWMYIDAEAGCYLVADASTSAKRVPKKTAILAPMTPTGTGAAHIIVNASDVSGTTAHCWLKNCAPTGQGDTSNPLVTGCGFVYMSGVLATTPGRFLIGRGMDNVNVMLVRETDVSALVGGASPMVANGLYVASATSASFGEATATASTFQTDGCVYANLAIYKLGGTSGGVQFNTFRTYGSAMINVLIESVSVNSLAVLGINRDGNLMPTKQHYVYNLGLYGPYALSPAISTRENAGYEDAASITTPQGWFGGGAAEQAKKQLVHKGCVINEFNFKTDVFASNGNNIHTWNVGYHLGFSYNAYLVGDSNGGTAPGRGVHLGEVLNKGEFVAGATSALFVNWKASAALAGGGDYTPAAMSSLTSKMPIDEWPCKFDIHGATRNNTGAGAFGPIKAAAE